MSAKISAAKRAAFLKAIEETGNQTLAAERAKVSRSWVVLHRSRDPEFDAAVRAAVEAAKARLSDQRSSPPHGTSGNGAPDSSGSNGPPCGWRFFAGEELVVRGTGGGPPAGARQARGRRVQIARARVKQWTPRVEDRFLATLAATCNVKAACAEVRMTPASAYNHRHRWPAFATRWDEAEQIGHWRLDAALLAGGINLFSGEGVSAETPIPPMSVDDVIRTLGLHSRKVRGTGGRPGRAPREPSIEEVRANILRRLDAIEREEEIGALKVPGGRQRRRG